MIKRPPLNEQEINNKQRLQSLIAEHKPAWEKRNNDRLTQERLGELAGELINGEPMTQGAVWQYTSENSNTRLNSEFVQACASVLGFPPSAVSEEFSPISGVHPSAPIARIVTMLEQLSPADVEIAEEILELMLKRSA